MVLIVWSLDLQLHVQSVPITTRIVSSNPVHGEVYSIQYYVIKVCQWLATGPWFSPVSATNKTDRHDTTEILLKVALNTINPYNDRHKSSFHEMMMVPVLYQTITMSWICSYNANKLKQNFTNKHVAPYVVLLIKSTEQF